MEAVVVGIVAYNLILFRAVKICADRELMPGKSFTVGAVAGGMFVFTVHVTAYLVNERVMLINNNAFYTVIASLGAMLLGGLQCYEAQRRVL